MSENEVSFTHIVVPPNIDVQTETLPFVVRRTTNDDADIQIALKDAGEKIQSIFFGNARGEGGLIYYMTTFCDLFRVLNSMRKELEFYEEKMGKKDARKLVREYSRRRSRSMRLNNLDDLKEKSETATSERTNNENSETSDDDIEQNLRNMKLDIDECEIYYLALLGSISETKTSSKTGQKMLNQLKELINKNKVKIQILEKKFNLNLDNCEEPVVLPTVEELREELFTRHIEEREEIEEHKMKQDQNQSVDLTIEALSAGLQKTNDVLSGRNASPIPSLSSSKSLKRSRRPKESKSALDDITNLTKQLESANFQTKLRKEDQEDACSVISRLTNQLAESNHLMSPKPPRPRGKRGSRRHKKPQSANLVNSITEQLKSANQKPRSQNRAHSIHSESNYSAANSVAALTNRLLQVNDEVLSQASERPSLRSPEHEFPFNDTNSESNFSIANSITSLTHQLNQSNQIASNNSVPYAQSMFSDDNQSVLSAADSINILTEQLQHLQTPPGSFYAGSESSFGGSVTSRKKRRSRKAKRKKKQLVKKPHRKKFDLFKNIPVFKSDKEFEKVPQLTVRLKRKNYLFFPFLSKNDPSWRARLKEVSGFN